MPRYPTLLCLAACAAALAGCAPLVPTGAAPAAPAATVLFSSEQAIGNLVFDAGRAYLTLGNGPGAGTAVLATGEHLTARSAWTALDRGDCALGPATGHQVARVPQLASLAPGVYLFQPAHGATGEHALCQFDLASARFAARDAGLRLCQGGHCPDLWMTHLHYQRGHLFANAGAGPNVLASADNGRTWRALLGSVESYMCSHQAFRLAGNRLLVGGECPLDVAYLRAYPLASDGVSLQAPHALPIVLPELGNRNVHLFEQAGESATVFAGVEGGVLRSDDGGATFRFVLHYPLNGRSYPSIKALLVVRDDARTIVAGGVDRVNGQAWLQFSRSGGARWTDLSALLPAGQSSQVTSLVQDRSGRILVTMDAGAQSQGRLLQLSLP